MRKIKVRVERDVEMELYEFPIWCKSKKSNLDLHKDYCCFCGKEESHYQEGDGRFLHSLCFDCYIKIKIKAEVLKK